jgi:hypothetical protein
LVPVEFDVVEGDVPDADVDVDAGLGPDVAAEVGLDVELDEVVVEELVDELVGVADGDVTVPDVTDAGGAGMTTNRRPPSFVRAISAHRPCAHGTVPRRKNSLGETTV